MTAACLLLRAHLISLLDLGSPLVLLLVTQAQPLHPGYERAVPLSLPRGLRLHGGHGRGVAHFPVLLRLRRLLKRRRTRSRKRSNAGGGRDRYLRTILLLCCCYCCCCFCCCFCFVITLSSVIAHRRRRSGPGLRSRLPADGLAERVGDRWSIRPGGWRAAPRTQAGSKAGCRGRAG